MNINTVWKKIKRSSLTPIVTLLIFILVLFSILAPNFMTKNNIMNVLRQVSMIGIAGCGMMTVLLAGGIDLSIGAMVAFVNISCAYMMVNLGMHPVPACILGVLIATAIGTINGILISYLDLMAIITTLCMMYVLRGLSYIITGSQPIFGLDPNFKIIGQGYLWGIPIPVIIMVVIALIAGILLKKTYIGRYFYYVGGNEEATKLSGVNTRLIRCLSYSLSGFFTGIASIVWLSRINSGQPQTANSFEFDVICALVLGGISTVGGEGGILGGMIGVIAIGFLNNGMTMVNLSDNYQMVVKGLVLLFAIILDRTRTILRKKDKDEFA